MNFVSPFDLLKAPNQGNIFHLVSAIVGLADRPNTIFGKKSKPTEKVKLVCPRGHHKEVKLKVRRNGQS